MNIDASLEQKLRSLPGRPMTADEAERLHQAIPELAVPAVTELLRGYPIIGSELSLPAELDESGLGVELLWLSGDQIIGEATEAQPGVAAARHGFLPIGACLLGSGDPYFLDTSEPEDPPLVRISHHAAVGDGELDPARIEVVSSSLSSFLGLADAG